MLPAIADAPLDLPSALAALVEDAAGEVARFDADLGAELAPFGALLLRSESAASSKIENLTASARAVAEAELGVPGRSNARQIVANARAMEAAIELADHIDGASILAMHEALLGTADPSIAGRWRTQQVWIGGHDHGPHGASFVPPHHEHVEAAIADLVAFVAREDLPVLAHAAIAHAQFESIHPFPDGNGRTGRALLHAHLRNKALTRRITVPVSAGLLTDTAGYFAALDRYRDGDPAPIISQVSEAAFRAVGNGTALVEELREIRAGWTDRIKARRDAAAWRILDVLFRHPVVGVDLVATELGIAPQNVYRNLALLEDAAVIVEFTDKKRNRLWRAPAILDALDAFAARAGRRSRTG